MRSELFGTFDSAVRIDPELCKEWGEEVCNLDKNFHHMGSGVSLGCVYYKNLADGLLHSYHCLADKENELLSNHFPELEIAFLAQAKEVVGLDLPLVSRASKYHDCWSKFAFTIASISSEEYSNDPAYFSKDGAIIVHRDLEGFSPYPELLFDKNVQAYSAVLSLAIPEEGGGLIIYPKRFAAAEFNAPSWSQGHNNDVNYQRLLEGRYVKPIVIDYTPGTLTIFDSMLFHEVMPIVVSPKNPNRIVALTHFLVLDKPFPHIEYWV